MSSLELNRFLTSTGRVTIIEPLDVACMNRREWCKAILKENGAALAVTASLLGFSLWLHLSYEWSPLQLPDEDWKEKLDLHLTWAPFAIRYFQSYSTLALHNLFGWPFKESFFAIQFSLALILGPVMHRYLRRLGFNPAWSLVGLVLTFTAYPIMGAHFEPTHTWDDFWAYLFLVLTLMSALDRRPLATAFWLTLGCFAREQTLLFYPVVLMTLWWQRAGIRRSSLVFPAVVPLLLYGLFRVWRWDRIDPTRWKLAADNFSDARTTQDSLVSLIIAFGIMWLLALAGLWWMSEISDKTNRSILRWGMATAVPLTTAVALLFTFARETRIMFPSFVIIVPLSLVTLRAGWNHIARHRWLWLFGVAAALVPAIWVGLDLADKLFPKFAYGATAMFRRDIAGIHIGLGLVFLICILAAGIDRLRPSIQTANNKKNRPGGGG